MPENENEGFTETPRQRFDREMREYEGQNIQDYSVRLTAWFATKLEKDKSVLTISSAAVGLLVSVLVGKGIQNYLQIFLFVIALLGFMIAIIAVIQIFDKNAEQVERNIADGGHINNILSRYEMIISISFYIGIFFTILLGISYGVNQYIKEKGEKKVAEDKSKSSQEILNENYGNSNNLKPKTPVSQAVKPQPSKPKKGE